MNLLLVLAQQSPAAPASGSSPFALALVFGLLTLVPAVLLLGTSFVKMSVVLGVLRNAFGAQHLPGNLAVMGLSAVLTLHVMAPTARAVWRDAGTSLTSVLASDPLSTEGLDRLGRAWDAGSPAVKRFLRANSTERDRALFVSLARDASVRQGAPETVSEDALRVLLPAFALSELARAFVMAFLVLLPFLVVDLVVANVLMAMGLGAMSPASAALPFKLLLFVLADGWHLLARALVLGYR
jgi:type III secretion protein R